MQKLIASLTILVSLTLMSSHSLAETNNLKVTIIEMASITILKTNSQPYAEFKPCEHCPYRLLSFSPSAQIYLNGKKTSASELNNGQIAKGTLYIQHTPTESISELVAH
jgi:hypothetical protein